MCVCEGVCVAYMISCIKYTVVHYCDDSDNTLLKFYLNTDIYKQMMIVLIRPFHLFCFRFSFFFFFFFFVCFGDRTEAIFINYTTLHLLSTIFAETELVTNALHI